MNTTHPELPTSPYFQGLTLPARPTSGTDDDRDDEHAGENEAAVRAIDEGTEAPEEFEFDDELAHPENDEAEEDEEEVAGPQR
jgi:hypothetical protein